MTHNKLIMKRYSIVIGVIVAVTCSSLVAQEKSSLQPNATILSILQGSTGKTVELRLNSGEKIGGKVEQVNDNLVLLSHLTSAEFFDGFVSVKDISAVVIRSAGK
jgi:small nuclear ribonucleoprotein (snRNP)-like protein